MPDSLQSYGQYSLWNSPGQNTGVGSLSLLQGIFPAQGLNPGLPSCRCILYQLSHKGIPRLLEWVAYPFSSGSSQPRNWTRVSCIAGGLFTNWAIRENFTYVTYTLKHTECLINICTLVEKERLVAALIGWRYEEFRRQWHPTLAWKIPLTEEPGRLQSMGSHRVGHDWSDLAAAAARRNLNICLLSQFYSDDSGKFISSLWAL